MPGLWTGTMSPVTLWVGVRCVDLSSTAVMASDQAPITLSLPTDLTFLSSPPISSPQSHQAQFPPTEAKCWQRGKRRQRVIPCVRTESGMLGRVRINGIPFPSSCSLLSKLLSAKAPPQKGIPSPATPVDQGGAGDSAGLGLRNSRSGP